MCTYVWLYTNAYHCVVHATVQKYRIGHLLIFDNVYFNYKITVKSDYNDQFAIYHRNLINLQRFLLFLALSSSSSLRYKFYTFDSFLEKFTVSLLPLQSVRIVYIQCTYIVWTSQRRMSHQENEPLGGRKVRRYLDSFFDRNAERSWEHGVESPSG